MSVDGFAIADRGLKAAASSFRSDLMGSLLTLYDPRAQVGRMTVGMRKPGNGSFSSSAWVGLEIKAVFCRGASFIIDKIHVGLTSSGPVQAFLNSDIPGFEEVPLNLTSVAETWAPNPLQTALELPFETLDGFAPQFWLSYQIGSRMFIDQPFVCCGGTEPFAGSFSADGFESTTKTGLSATTRRKSSYGLILEGRMVCDPLGWVCQQDAMGGYSVASVVARTVQMRAAANAIQELLLMGLFSGSPAFSAPEQTSKMNFLNQRANENILWLAENMTPGQLSGCLKCKESASFRIASQFV